jgi:hypothetical protein
LPEPVGAATSVELWALISGQARFCASVGAGKCRLNQAATAGWKPSSELEVDSFSAVILLVY